MTSHPDKRSFDIHAHMVVPEIVAWAKGHGVVNIEPPAERISAEARQETQAWGDKNAAVMRDINLRLAAMDRTGVDVQALSLSSVMSPTCWAPPEVALQKQRQVNDAIATMMVAHPGRFAGLGEIPLHSPRLAIEEMTRCVNESQKDSV